MSNVVSITLYEPTFANLRQELASIRTVSREEMHRLVGELRAGIKKAERDAKRVKQSDTVVPVRVVVPGGVLGLLSYLSLQASLSGAAFSSQPDTLK